MPPDTLTPAATPRTGRPGDARGRADGVRLAPATVATVATVALAFQLAHTGEHLAQVWAWIVDPSGAPWMSGWALAVSEALAPAGRSMLGRELLHLVGNAVFLGGAVALRVALRSPEARRLANGAMSCQLAHVAEHVLLTISVVTAGRPVGVTNGFGVLDAGATAIATRVWVHAVINVAVTGLAIAAVGRARRSPLSRPRQRRAHR